MGEVGNLVKVVDDLVENPACFGFLCDVDGFVGGFGAVLDSLTPGDSFIVCESFVDFGVLSSA